MSYLNITDVATYTPPENTSLIYKESEGVFKYKTSAGLTGDVASSVLPLLAVELTDIPCLVFTEDLNVALAKTVVPVENVTVAMSSKAVAAYTDEIAKRKVDKTDFLSALSRTGEAIEELQSDVADNKSAIAAETTARETADSDLQGQIDTINTTLDTLGSVDGGSIADALATKVDKTTYDAKVAELVAADATKVDKVTGSSLVADSEISKLAFYPAYAEVQRAIAEKQTAAQVTAAIQAVIVDYYTSTQTDAKIAAAVASAFKYMGVAADYTNLPADLTENDTGKVYHVNTKDGKTVNSEYAWNGTAWEELGSVVDLSDYAKTADVTAAINAAIAQEVTDRNAAIKVTDDKAVANAAAIAKEVTDREAAVAGINAGNVALTGYVAEEGDAVTLEATDTVNAAFDKVVAHLTELDGVSGGAVSGLAELTNRVDAAEGEIDVLQAATAGYDGDNTVAAAISAAQSAAEATAAADATSKAGAAESAAKSYTDEEITKAKTDIGTAYAAADTTINGRIDTLDSVVGANKTAIEGALSQAVADIEAEETRATEAEAGLSQRIAANEAAISSLGTISSGSLKNALDGKVDADVYGAKISELEAINAAFNDQLTVLKTTPYNVVIVGNDEEPPTVDLTVGDWYVVKGKFTGTLPAGAAEGTYIKVSVAVGGDGRSVVPAAGETILGSSNQCAIGITPEGVASAAETYVFMRIGNDWVIL